MAKCFVSLGKSGDILSIVPILQEEFRVTGEKPVLVTSKEYASVVSRIDNLEVCALDCHWQHLDTAVRFAKQNFPQVLIPQMHGNGVQPERKRASFQLDQWERCGYYDKWDKLPLTIPRNDLVKFPQTMDGPFILLGDHSESSPFAKVDELHAALAKAFPSHRIVRLSSIRCKNLTDLLMLYDAAELLVTIETAHIHLSKATETPVIALATDQPSRWHGSAGSMKFAFYCHYDEFDDLLPMLIKSAIAVIGRKGFRHKKFVVRRTAAIGDAIAATVVATRMRERGLDCEFQTHKDVHCAIRRIPGVTLSSGKEAMAHVNLDWAYERNPRRREKHFHQMFMEKANRDLSYYGLEIGNEFNCKPVMLASDDDRQKAIALIEADKP